MHSFFVDAPLDGRARMLPEEARHALKVLRLRQGDEVCALDPAGGRWQGVLELSDGAETWVRLVAPLSANQAPVSLTVYQGIPKSDKLDWVVQKLTELGAAALVPVRMDRCVARMDRSDGGKRERLERIAREAAKQCGRGLPLRVAPPMAWPEALEAMARHDLLLIPWEEASGFRMKDAHGCFPDAGDIGVVIGPEGGIAPKEVAAMTAIGGRTITLGPRILRTETAAVVSAALTMQLWGDL
ncbi:MAG: 16S rRNA (uracil(1498)-N(3))-methyltransferase [Clostridia bacterium]|nr:16S rRNA (uracil(1498)-N(3))-methyltransferase [Clostridia bacterium]